MNKYFTLYPTTKFTYSNEEGCLYNTLNGNVIALSKEQKDLLIMSENGNRVDQLDSGKLKFYDSLEHAMLGAYGEHPIAVESTFWGENGFFDQAVGKKRSFEILQIELTGDCNFNCIFCEKESDLVFRKTGCKRWGSAEKENNLSFDEWSKYIKEASYLGCKKVQLFGGEPLLDWARLKKLLLIINDIGIEDIEIYTNASLLDDDNMCFFKERNIKLKVQISNVTNNHQILGISKDLDYQEILDTLQNHDIRYEVLLLISKYNEEFFEEYIKMFQEIGCKYQIDFIHPYPHNSHYSEKYKGFVLDYKKKLVKVNPMNLGVLQLKNPCYSKMVAISVTGEVYPCIMSRFLSYGKLDGDNSLTDVLNEEYDLLKNLTKSKMHSCKECVYRYACLDCSAIEISASKGLFSCKNCSLIEA